MIEKEEVKEKFCAPCLALPLMITGASGVGVSQSGKSNNILLGVSVVLTLVGVWIYYSNKDKKSCKKCKS